MFDRAALKAQAKERMAVSDPNYRKVMLLWFLVSAMIPAVVQGLVMNPFDEFVTLLEMGLDPMVAMKVFGGSGIVGIFVSIVLFFFEMVMTFGLVHYTLALWRGDECRVNMIFDGFSMVGRVIGADLLSGLFAFLWGMLLMIPYFLVIALGVMLDNGLGIALILVGYVVFMVGMVMVALRYALVSLALADHPERGALAAIRSSKQLMKGHKGSYVMLSLSFLGWVLLFSLPVIIVTGVTAGLGMNGYALPSMVSSVLVTISTLPIYLWLEMYMQLCFAGFYDALSAEAEMPPLEEYPQF